MATWNNLVNKSRRWRRHWGRDDHGGYTLDEAQSLLGELTQAYLAEKSKAGSQHLKVEIDFWEMLI